MPEYTTSSFAPARFVDGIEDLAVPGATAQISGKPFADFVHGGMWILRQKMNGSHQHSRCTDAALRPTRFGECLLQGMQVTILAQFFHSTDSCSRHLHHGNETTIH